MSIAASILYGLVNLFHPRMLWLMVWPMLVALALWGGLALALWTRTALWLASIFAQWTGGAATVVNIDGNSLALFAANAVLVLLFIPLVYLTALFILGIFGMQQMVEYVASRACPALERHRGGGAVGSGWNALVALLGMGLLFLVTLPLWLAPPLWPLIPLGVLAWGNQRLMRYDALAEHATREEMGRLFRERRGALLLLGLLMGIAAFVPLAGFAAPVVFGLAFIRYLLAALEAMRARPAPHSPPLSLPSE